MSAGIKPIETRYKGYRFRSRLEARWAAFFDHAGIPWEYEPEGFNINGRCYLPDFRLPECGTWIEVKPEMPDAETLGFLGQAALHLPRRKTAGEWGPEMMLVGPIPELHPKRLDIAWPTFCDGGTSYGFGLYAKNRRPWWLGTDLKGQFHAFDSHETMYIEVAGAYRMARSARFEHGETPTTEWMFSSESPLKAEQAEAWMAPVGTYQEVEE
jgi:hypothetical protein